MLRRARKACHDVCAVASSVPTRFRFNATEPSGTAVALPHRIAASLFFAMAAGAVVLWLRLGDRSNFSDFDQLWIAARAIIHRENPYAAVPAAFPWPLYYPLPAAVVAIPLAWPRVEWAHALWTALGTGFLVFALLERGWWTLLVLASFPYLDALRLGQWSPLFTAAALLPGLAWVVVGKPTTAFATVGAYANRFGHQALLVAGAIAAILVGGSFAASSTWIVDWIRAVRGAHHFVPLVARPWGFLMLASLARWRRPEARLIALLAIVPQTAAPYECLPLVLALTSRREAIIFVALSLVAVPFLARPASASELMSTLQHNAPIMLGLLYLPVAVMVLLRPNVGVTTETKLRATSVV